MDAVTGVSFLKMLVQQRLVDKEDIDKAVKIASSKSPSAAFDAAQQHFILKHGQGVLDGYLAFAKGTRWLAMLRRDFDRKVFEKAVDELDSLFGGGS